VGFLSTIRKRLEDAGAQARKRVPEFQVEFDCPPEIRDSDVLEAVGDPSHVVFLYRIVLEAIINARKHSGGTRIGVKLSRPEPGLLEISIYDDGRGGGGPFEQNVGIPLMLRRAQEIGAEIVFRKASAAGGTAVVIRFGPHSMFPG
jgi:nitrate/nitrite-specific signal transduction histidine kinase